MTETDLMELEALCAAATPPPWETSVSPTTTVEEAAEQAAKHVRAGDGVKLYGVWCPDHPGTAIGEDRTHPAFAVHAALTGNGPTSAPNADFIAAARTAVPFLLSEVRRLMAELAAAKEPA